MTRGARRVSGQLRCPSPAIVISLIALFVALGGTSYAVITLPRNSVGTKQLKNNAVTSTKIRTGAVTAAKINPTGLTVPNAAVASNATNAGNAAQLQGKPASSFAPTGHETVHLVGSSGEPVFQNGWRNYGSGFSSVGFWKDAFGVIHLQGRLTGGTATTAFTLPAGYRPAENLFMVVATGAASGGFAYIHTNGDVVMETAGGDYSFDGLSFLGGS